MHRLRSRPSPRARVPFAPLLALAIALTAWGGRAAWAEDQTTLGQLEQETLADGIERTGATIDPVPQGKIVGDIRVVNEEVFSRRDWWLQFFNHFHRTTRETVMAREVLLRPGQVYNQDLIDETIRNLRSPGSITFAGTAIYPPELSSVIAIVPIVSPRPGQVDLLVVTRDVWSLRFNTNFETQGGTLTLLDTSLSENNLFGWRKYAAVRFRMDQGAIGIGPTYFDPNIHGTHLTLYALATLWYGRQTERYDGNSEAMFLHYPLYSLASRWGAGVDVTHYDTVVRHFQGTGLLYDYRQRRVSVDGRLTRSFGTDVIQRASVGYLVDNRRFSVLPDFPATSNADEFLNMVAPRSEQRSEPYLRYELFTPRYMIIRDMDTFELRENLQLGPRLAARVSFGLPALGADRQALGLGVTSSYAISPKGGYARLWVSASTRLFDDGRFWDQLATGQLFVATPPILRAFRIVVEADGGAARADTQNTHFYVGGGAWLPGPGGSTGLRGYDINELDGTSMLVGRIEARSYALRLFSQRLGVLLFYEVGGVAGDPNPAAPPSEFGAHQDAGFGLRWLIPQLNSSVVRVDWAVPFNAGPITTHPGLPGVITAGFDQSFQLL